MNSWKKLLTLWIVLIVVVGAAPPAWAAETLRSLTLTDVIDTALKDNPEIQAARYQVQAAASNATAARSGLLPQIYLSEAFNHTDSPLWAFGTKLNQGIIEASDFDPHRLNDPDAVDNFNTALSLSWNVYDGGRSRIGWHQARQAHAVAQRGLQRSEQQVIAQAAKAYVGLLLAIENRHVIVQSLETARAHLKLVDDRFRGGLAVKSDVLRARVHIADLEQQRLLADSQVRVARAMLYAVMGRSGGGEVALATPFEKCIPTQADLDAWINRALARRPDLQQLDLQMEIARKEVDRVRSGHWPTLALQGNYEMNTEDFSDSHDNYTVGAVLRLNLYSGRRISARTAAAKAMLSRVESMRQGLVLGLRVETQKAFYQAQSTWQSIIVARTAVEQAREGLRIVSNRYRGGLLTIVDLLDAQVALQQARTKLFKAMHDYKVARIDLALASGTIDRTFM